MGLVGQRRAYVVQDHSRRSRALLCQPGAVPDGDGQETGDDRLLRHLLRGRGSRPDAEILLRRTRRFIGLSSAVSWNTTDTSLLQTGSNGGGYDAVGAAASEIGEVLGRLEGGGNSLGLGKGGLYTLLDLSRYKVSNYAFRPVVGPNLNGRNGSGTRNSS